MMYLNDYREYTYQKNRYSELQKWSICNVSFTIVLTISVALFSYQFYLFDKNNDFVEITAISTKAINNKNFTCDSNNNNICHMVTVHAVYKVDHVYPAKIIKTFSQWSEAQIYLEHFKNPQKISLRYNRVNPKEYSDEDTYLDTMNDRVLYVLGTIFLSLLLIGMCMATEASIMDLKRTHRVLKGLQTDTNVISENQNRNNPKKKKHGRKNRPTYEMKERESFTCPICLEKQVNCTLSPCGHSYCKGCIDKIPNLQKCPFCNQRGISVIPLYINE